MHLLKKYCLLLLMLVMAVQAQQSAFGLAQAAIKGDAAAFAQLKTLGNKGNARAQYNLGFMYAEGTGVPQDFDQAVSWFRKSAEQGNALGQFSLGAMYANGFGVPKDLVIAYMWRNLAAAQGNEEVKKAREALEKEMTPSQIAEGQRLSREWKPKP